VSAGLRSCADAGGRGEQDSGGGSGNLKAGNMMRVDERKACSCLRFSVFCARVAVLVAFAAGSAAIRASVCRRCGCGAEQIGSAGSRNPFPWLSARASKQSRG
jgi:hypothetical protein